MNVSDLNTLNELSDEELTDLVRNDPELFSALRELHEAQRQNVNQQQAVPKPGSQLSQLQQSHRLGNLESALNLTTARRQYQGLPTTFNAPPDRRWILYLAGGAIGSLTLIICSAIFTTNSPNAHLTRQQEAMALLAMEASKQKPTIVCLFAWKCPGAQDNEAQDEPRADSESVPYSQPVTVPSRNAGYDAWFRYWESQSMANVHRAANSYAPEDCQAVPGMCESMNTVKRLRMARGDV